MRKDFEVRWEGELPGVPLHVWDAITMRSDGYLWPIAYEPWVGGAETGLTGGGAVTRWEPSRHFTTRAEDGDGFNELDYILEPRGAGTYLRYVHRGVLAEETYELELDACRQHTAFYLHSLGEYVGHFSGREPLYVSADGPEASAVAGSGVVRRALGLAENVAVGDRVRLTPAGIEPIEGVVDYLTPAFLGVRSVDALYRVYGRDVWGWPVSVAHHLFAGGVNSTDKPAAEQAWGAWLDGVFAARAVG